MFKLSLKFDVSLSKLVFGFVGLSAAATAVYYLSSKNENKFMKVEDASSSKVNNKCNDLTVGESTNNR